MKKAGLHLRWNARGAVSLVTRIGGFYMEQLGRRIFRGRVLHEKAL